MNSLSCWRDDQHPVARNDFGLGKTVVLDEVHHRAEMSMQRSTAAWSSFSYVTKGAFPQTAFQRLTEEKEDRFVVQMSLPSRDCFHCARRTGL